MRTLATIVIIIVFLLGGSLASHWYIGTMTQSLEAQLETVEQSVSTQKWEGAQKELKTALQLWDKNKTWWTILLDHQEIDNIDLSMKRSEKYIATQEIPLSLGEIAALKLLVDHIYETEEFTLRNIF